MVSWTYRNGKMKRICKYCGKEFVVFKSRVKQGRGIYCSKKCRNCGYSKNFTSDGNPNWKDGLSNEPYPFDFNKELKELIRKRDNYKCQICGCPQMECERKLDVHHKDRDKNNLDPENLISLCRSCHIRLERKNVKTNLA